MIDVAMLRAVGVTDQQIAKLFELVQRADLEKAAEKREADRIRQRNHRLRTRGHSDSSDTRDTPIPSSSPSHSPNNYPTPSFPFEWPADAAEQFWAKFPNKVAKRAGLKALESAHRRVAFDVLMAGLDRYIATQNPDFYCHPASWLNADRWLDEPKGRNDGPAARNLGTNQGAGRAQTGNDAILAGMGRIAARIDQRRIAEERGRDIPADDDVTGPDVANPKRTPRDPTAFEGPPAVARSDPDSDRDDGSGDFGFSDQIDVRFTRTA